MDARTARIVGAGSLLVLLGALLPGFAGAQTPDGPPPVDTAGLATGPFSAMEMLYERTIFHVDVLTLSLRFDEETAAELRRLVEGQSYSDALADSVARVALDAHDVLVRSRFERDVSLNRFLDGLRDSLEKARRAGLITEPGRQAIVADVDVQYQPLAEEGIEEGEIMWYRIRGDSLHVAFQALDGSVPVEERPVGEERRMGVLAGYLAPGSDFREKLVRSLFQRPPPTSRPRRAPRRVHGFGDEVADVLVRAGQVVGPEVHHVAAGRASSRPTVRPRSRSSSLRKADTSGARLG